MTDTHTSKKPPSVSSAASLGTPPTLPDRPQSTPPPKPPRSTATAARTYSPAPSSTRSKETEQPLAVGEEVEIYENERRDQSGKFSSAALLSAEPAPLSTAKGEPVQSLDSIEPRPGWEWTAAKWTPHEWQYSTQFSGNLWTGTVST